MVKIGIILGTRPEIIKMSPIIKYCEENDVSYFVIHTSQHYSYNMDRIFFEELNIPLPKYNLGVKETLHGKQTGLMLERIEKVLIKEKPSIVLVQGDTNSVLAGALAASKLHIKVGHVEAGLRSYYREMPEEINRVITDHISDLLFVPTDNAKNNLIKEGISPDKIFVTGNTIVDVVKENMNKLKLKKGNYVLVTAHRQESVDCKEKLQNIMLSLNMIHKQLKVNYHNLTS